MYSNLDVGLKSTFVVTNKMSQSYGLFGSNEALQDTPLMQPWWYQSSTNNNDHLTASQTPVTSHCDMHYNSGNFYTHLPGAAGYQNNNNWYNTDNILDSPDSGYFSPSMSSCDTPYYMDCRAEPKYGSGAGSCGLSSSSKLLPDILTRTRPTPQFQTTTDAPQFQTTTDTPQNNSLVFGWPRTICSSGSNLTTDRRCAKRNLNYSPPPREGISCEMVVRTPSSVAQTKKSMRQTNSTSCLESVLTTQRAVPGGQEDIKRDDNCSNQWPSCMMAGQTESGGPTGKTAGRNASDSKTHCILTVTDGECRQQAKSSDTSPGVLVDPPNDCAGFSVGLPVLFTGSLDSQQKIATNGHRAAFQLVCFNCVDTDSVFSSVSEDESSTKQTSNETAGQSETLSATQGDQPADDIQKTLVTTKSETHLEVPNSPCTHGRQPEECPVPSRIPGAGSNKRESLQILVLEAGQLGSHLCFGCQKPVFDRYVIQVKDHGFWHADCLRCSNCQDNLSGHRSCYVKNEQVFCRNDYNILFGLSCVKCSLQFKREQDWMRVAGQHRYHIACFLCKICKRQLGNNEKYHLVNGTDIYCTNHYRDMVNGDNSDGQQPPKKAKRNRTSYTEAQIKFLQDRFLRDSNPDGNELEKIASHINLKKRVVQVWFQNNRARLKKSANNTKGGNQENKSSSMNNGVSGVNAMSELMDWDNSLEHSSLDEHTFPNSGSPQAQLRPGSAHFLDSSYGVGHGLAGSLICLTSGTPVPTGHEHGTFCDGSGASTCGTPRDQASPQFSEMSNPSFPAGEIAAHDNRLDELAATNYSKSLGGPNSYPNKVGSGVNTSTNSSGARNRTSPGISFSKTSGTRDKFSEECPGRSEEHTRHSALTFQEPSLRHPPHSFSSQLYSPDSPYGAQLGLYGNLYNMYTGYAALHDPHYELSEHHPSFLRIKEHQRLPGFVSGVEASYETPYSGDASLFSRTQLVDASSGFMSTRSPFGNSQTANARASANTSPLSFLGSSTPLHQPRAVPVHSSFPPDISPGAGLSCGQSLGLLRSCGSPEEITPSSYLHSAQNRGSDTYFPTPEHV